MREPLIKYLNLTAKNQFWNIPSVIEEEDELCDRRKENREWAIKAIGLHLFAERFRHAVFYKFMLTFSRL